MIKLACGRLRPAFCRDQQYKQTIQLSLSGPHITLHKTSVGPEARYVFLENGLVVQIWPMSERIPLCLAAMLCLFWDCNT